MITYEVTLNVVPERAERLDNYMLDKHIEEVVATGCFTSATYYRDGDRRRTIYEAENRETLDLYLRDFSTKLRDDFAEHFPEGVTPSREEWTAVCRFDSE